MDSGSPGLAGIAGAFGVSSHQCVPERAELVDGPLRVASARATRTARSGAVLCLLDGWVSNARELVQRLDLGVDAGDTAAVVATGYSRLGESILSRLRGEFVVLLWDGGARRGLIARDQMGGRAVYLCREDRGLIFASEVRDLLGMLRRTPAPDRTVVLDWLSLRHHAGPETLHEGIAALLPGQLVRFGPGGVEFARYWTPRYREPTSRSPAEAAEEIRGGVDRALDRTLGARTRVGVLLSGGLDSASIAVLAQRTGVDVHGYSAVFPAMPSVDESAYIDRVAAHSSLAVSRMAIHGGSMLRSALGFSRDWRVPLASQNLEFWLPLMGRAVDDGAQVILDGEGGDLLFAARPELIGDRLRRGRLLAAVQLARSLPGGRDAPWASVMSVVAARGGRVALPAGLHQAVRRRGSALRDVAPWIRPADGALVVAADDEWAWKRLDGPRWWGRLAYALTDGLHAVGIRDHQRRRAMLAGLETRSPFFDVDLVESMLSMPPELAFDGLSRPLQREIVVGRLPDEVRLRAGKSYFDELFHRTLAVEDLAAVERLLTADDAELRGWVDMDAVRASLLDPGPRHCAGGPRFWLKAVWRLATAECWLREQADPGFADRLLAGAALRAPQVEFVEQGPTETAPAVA